MAVERGGTWRDCHDRPDMAYLFFFIFLYFPSSITRDPVPSPLSSLLTRFLRMSGLYLQTLTRTPMPLRSSGFHSILVLLLILLTLR